MLARIYGSRVDISAEHVYRPPVVAQFPADKLLELRMAAARQALPANSIKSLRDLSLARQSGADVRLLAARVRRHAAAALD
jgi:hypothetical protein